MELEDEDAKKRDVFEIMGTWNENTLYIVAGQGAVDWCPLQGKLSAEQYLCSFGEGRHYCLDGKPVQPLRYVGGDQEVAVRIRMHKNSYTSPIRLVLRDDVRGTKCVFTNYKESRMVKGEVIFLRLACKVNDVLTALDSKINCNRILATVCIGPDDFYRIECSTVKPLHVLRQKLIVLLPGVLATEMNVLDKNAQHAEPAWPPPMVTTNKRPYLANLLCDEHGQPVKPAHTMTFIEKPSPLSGPYYSMEWEELLNKEMPKLTFDDPGRPCPYYLLYEYPYDWRLNAHEIVDALLGDAVIDSALPKRMLWHDEVAMKWAKKSENPHIVIEKMPSLASILRSMRFHGFCFLDDHVALAGHSTGGVIMNGLLRRPKAKQIVDHGFFIATPFFGAPKAYLAFLTGDMDFPGYQNFIVWSHTQFVKLVRNAPVVYHLAPTRLSGHTARIYTEDGERSFPSTDDPEAFMTLIANNMRQGNEAPHDNEPIENRWNAGLAQVAADFHQECRQPLQIDANKCLVFYTEYSKGPTRGNVVYDARTPTQPVPNTQPSRSARVMTENVKGDKTVPLESLLGPPELQNRRCRIDADVDHVDIVGEDQLWLKLLELVKHSLEERK